MAAQTIEMSPKTRTCNPRDSLESNKWRYLRFINCVPEQTLEKHQPTKAVSLPLTAGGGLCQDSSLGSDSKEVKSFQRMIQSRLMGSCAGALCWGRHGGVAPAWHHPLWDALGPVRSLPWTQLPGSWGSDSSYHSSTGSLGWKGP